MCNIKAIATVGLLLVMLFSANCTSGHDFNHQLNAAVKPYRFSIAGWEFKTYFERTKQLFSKREKIQNTSEVVNEYISLGNRIKDLKAQINATNQVVLQSQIHNLQKQQNNLANAVEKIIKRQTGEVLSELDIYQPWYRHVKLKVTFPPPDFKLETLPHLLVISPRNKIETMKDVFLVKDLSVEEMVSIEADIDTLNVSSLVVDLGGVSTYPNLVASDSDFQYILETCAHEWAHVYLAFTPLGFRHVLNITGLSHNSDIDTISETSADIIGKEIGAAIVKKYYPQFQSNSQNVQSSSQTVVNKPTFDFDQEMRDIRKIVDQYLSAGEIDIAEKFMQEKRDYLAANGYYIRKLNQAYFAFNGKYADVPAFENPIGTKLSQLRVKSDSLKDFLNTVSSITSLQDLESALKQN
jgi:hypothetical protein